MSKLLIIQNITREGPGLLEQVLREEGIAFDVVDLGQGEALPDVTSYMALVVLGGPDSANDDTPKISDELAFIQQALNMRIPYLGICLGLQVLVKAADGKVVTGEVKEIGFINPDGNQHTIAITELGQSDPLLTGLPDKLDVFQLHGETVEITPTMQVLATGKFCQNQIIKVANNAYGIQSHFELTPEMLAMWAIHDPDLIPIGNEKLQSDYTTIHESYTNTGKALFKNFLKVAKLL